MSAKPLNQKGLTLLELLAVMAISALIVAAVASGIHQLFTSSDRDSNYMAAFGQVQNAGSWVSHDAVMAQQVTVDSDPATPEFITLVWLDWEGDEHQVDYTLADADDGLKKLMRAYSVNGGSAETVFVAGYIDSANTSCSWDGGMLTLVITAQVGEETATRTYNVKARPLS